MIEYVKKCLRTLTFFNSFIKNLSYCSDIKRWVESAVIKNDKLILVTIVCSLVLKHIPGIGGTIHF